MSEVRGTPVDSTGAHAEALMWQVAVDAPFAGALTYAVPSHLQALMSVGKLVKVPLGKRTASGVLVGPTQTAPGMQIKEILEVDSEYPALPTQFMQWLQWVSDYYLHPIGSTLGIAFPPLKKAKPGVKSRKRDVLPTITDLEYAAQADRVLTPHQQGVVDAILKKREQQGFTTHLLFGVTGSGKTEVYMQLLHQILQEGKKGIVLVPEISLTPQLIQRFVARFGDQVAVLHSQLTERERTNQWWEMVDGNKSILIGARSALFCPVDNLGLVIVDEEHEPSFKQEEKLKYHGRDAAVMLGKFSNCPVVLGSATPSLESWKNAKEGRYILQTMPSRVQDRSMPELHIVDMREQHAVHGQDTPKGLTHQNQTGTDLPHWLSPELFDALSANLAAGYQSALFLNRRGAAALVICPSCGFTHKCPNCDINLTLHGRSHMVCHYCDYHENLVEKCSDCKEGELTPVGLGTEALEKEIGRLFPGARLTRADRDEIQNRVDLEDMIQKMEAGEVDILIGTQMIAKGLDFPKLKLVGIILADIGFNIPDFRATERSFQLVTQVAGRSGRHVLPGEAPGQVVVQTFNPEHRSLEYSLRHDYAGFADAELQDREGLLYPPFGRLISIRISGNELARVQEAAKLFAKRGQILVEKHEAYREVEVLGPAPAPIAKLRGKHRYHLLLKAKTAQVLNRLCRQIIGDEQWVPSGVRISPDVDPLHLL